MPLKETGRTAKERIMARAKAMQTTNDRKQTQQETRQQPRQAENPLAGATGTPLEKMRGIGGLEDQETRQWNQAIGKMSRAQIERLSGTLDSALQGQKKQLAATEQVFNQLHGQSATEGLREQLMQQQARAKKTEERLNQLNAAREQAIFREYEDLRSSGDFAENSGYRTTANGKEAKIDCYMENNVFQNRVEDFIRNAQEFYESGGSAGEIDKEATAAKMMEMIAPGGSWNDALRTVKDWVQPQLNGLLGERGIYNGKDTVTDSGRRSFAQTHWDYTAENIVKAMNMAADKGANMYGVTPETLAATATREYRNVDEMHADEARLRTVSEEEHAKALRDLGIYLDRVVNDLMLTTMHRYEEPTGRLRRDSGGRGQPQSPAAFQDPKLQHRRLRCLRAAYRADGAVRGYGDPGQKLEHPAGLERVSGRWPGKYAQ